MIVTRLFVVEMNTKLQCVPVSPTIRRKFFKYRDRKIGSYDTFVVASYLSEKTKDQFSQTIYHIIYHDGGIVILKGNQKVQEIIYWLGEFKHIVDKASGKQHLQRIA